MRISIDIEPQKTQELEWYVKSILPQAVNEAIFTDKNLLKRMVRDCVEGNIRATINELLQGKDFRDYLKDCIKDYIGMNNRVEIKQNTNPTFELYGNDTNWGEQ